MCPWPFYLPACLWILASWPYAKPSDITLAFQRGRRKDNEGPGVEETGLCLLWSFSRFHLLYTLISNTTNIRFLLMWYNIKYSPQNYVIFYNVEDRYNSEVAAVPYDVHTLSRGRMSTHCTCNKDISTQGGTLGTGCVGSHLSVRKSSRYKAHA